MANNRNANIAVSVTGADASRQDLDKIRTAAESIGPAGAKGAQKLVDLYAALEKATGKVTQKYEEGKVITVRDGNAILQINERILEAEHAMFADLAKAPDAIQQAHAKAASQFSQSTAMIRKSTDAVQDNKEKLQEGGIAWTGFGDTINKAIGPLGGFQVGVLAAGAALTAGIAAGTKFAEAIGTNFSAAASAASNLKASIGSVTSAFVTDGFTAGMQQARAATRNFGDSVLDSGKAMDGFNVLVNDGVSRTKALAVSQGELRVIADAHTTAVEAGAKALKLFNDTVLQTDPKELSERLTALAGKFRDLAHENKLAVEKQKELREAHDAAIKTLDGYIKKLAEEREAHRLGLDAVSDEIAKYAELKASIKEQRDLTATQEKDIGGVTLSMRVLIEQLTPLIEHSDRYGTRISKINGHLQNLIAANETLDPLDKAKLKAWSDQISALATMEPYMRARVALHGEDIVKTTAANAANEARNVGLKEFAKGTESANTSHEKLNVTVENGKTVITSAGTEFKKAGTHVTDFSDSIHKTVIPALGDFDKMLDSLSVKTATFADVLEKLASGFHAVGDAAKKASGGEGGGAAGSSQYPEPIGPKKP